MTRAIAALLGLAISLSSGASNASPDIVYPKRESYPSDNTIGLASESPSQHSRAWISNDYDELDRNNQPVFNRLGGTYEGSQGQVSFVAEFVLGNDTPCFYAEQSKGGNVQRRTRCYVLGNGKDRIVFINLASGNNMQIRYDSSTSRREAMRFNSLWLEVTGEHPLKHGAD